MKKILLLFLSLLLLSGCSLIKLNDKDISQIVDETLATNTKLYNNVFNGYRVYIPRGIKVNEKNDYNVILTDNKNTYYLYVDIVSYYYKNQKDNELATGSYISKKLSNGDKSGYISIYDKEDKYFVKYTYNYAKIEAYVDKDYIKNSIMNMSYILNSIDYNDVVINDLFGENVLELQEEAVNIFESKTNKDKFLEYIEEDNNKIEEDEEEETEEN